MSNAEHLIENAIMNYEKLGNFDIFLKSVYNREMADAIGISLDDVTAMAMHIIWAFKQDWIQQGREEMIKRYGYDPPEELL